LILVVTHGGFIMEFQNLINQLVFKKKPVFNNSAQNCSIYKYNVFLKKKEDFGQSTNLGLTHIGINILESNQQIRHSKDDSSHNSKDVFSSQKKMSVRIN